MQLVISSVCFKLLSVLSYLRKPKTLVLSGKVQEIADLRVYYLCTILGRQHGSLTENSLMKCGGEIYELQRRSLASMKLSDSSNSLQVRVKLTKQLTTSEKRWRDRLLQLLEKGHLVSKNSFVNNYYSHSFKF